MKRKSGISLVILVITIVVLAILASVVAFVSADSIKNAKLAAFASDLNEIEDLIEEYYLNSNTLPIVNGITYSKSLVISLISEGADVLSDEITENGDDEAVFYRVDMSKLAIDDSIRGNELGGDETDIYLVSSKNFNLYYLKGEEISGDYYFSLTEKLTGKSKVDSSETEDKSNITISKTTSGIKLTKSTADWTNELTVSVDTTLATNETLEYFVAGESAGTSTAGKFTVDLAEILNANETLKNTFYSSDANKVLTINKYNTSTGSNVLVASAKINISNLDMLSGTVVEASNISYKEYTDFVLATITGYTDAGGSEVKEARILYTQKLDDDGNTVAYYEDLPSEITAEYVKNAGKSSAANVIKLPTDVVTYVIVFIDNAGNVSAPATYTVTY